MVKKLKKLAESQAAAPAGLLQGDLAGMVKDSAQQIWLAGMGAFAKAQAEGGKVFEALIQEGTALQRKTQGLAEDKINEVTGRMSNMAGEVTAKAGEQWDKLESIFESRTAKALGRLGVNLVHGAFSHWKSPRSLIETLLEHVGRDRLEIDWIHVAGPAFKDVDNRLLGLHLVRLGYTPAVLFDVDGSPLLASESIRHTRVLVERGRFAPVTNVNMAMLDRAREAFEAIPAATPNTPRGPIREIMEVTMNNLRDRGNAQDADFLARVDLINTVGKMVLVSDIGAFHALGEYLADRKVEATALVLGVPLLRELFNESHYRRLDGGILEAFGRLFTHGVRLYIYPTRDVITGKVVTANTLTVAPNLSHLLEHLRANGLILPLACDHDALLTYSSEDVRARICSGDPSWRDLVPPPVAAAIDRNGYFGESCPVE